MSASRAVLVTGAAGFLGGHVARAFAEAGWKVLGTDRSLARLSEHPAAPVLDVGWEGDLAHAGSELEAQLRAHRPEACIHLAGPASVAQSLRDPRADLYAQVPPTIELLDALRRTGGRTHLVLASSAAVYGEPDVRPTPEDAPPDPLSPYGYHKLIQEQLCRSYARLYDVPTTVARIFSTFGPGARHLAVAEIARRALRGDVQVRGTGEETRDYLYVSDVARALRLIAERGRGQAEVVHVASGIEVRMRTLIEEAFRGLGIAEAPRFEAEGEPGKPTRWCADVSTLTAWGFTPTTSLEDGLAATLRWIREDAAR